MNEPGAVITTILFTDLVGSTAFMQGVGDERAQAVFAAHHRLLSDLVAAHRGRELQWLGDGLMVAFGSAADAVRCAVAMQRAASQQPTGERLHLRVGLNAGEVLRLEIDTGSPFFGTAVVTARRLCDHAASGQILCSQTVAGLLAGRAAFSFRSLGAVALKGLAEKVQVCEVLYDEAERPETLLVPPDEPGPTREDDASSVDHAAQPAATWTRLQRLAAIVLLSIWMGSMAIYVSQGIAGHVLPVSNLLVHDARDSSAYPAFVALARAPSQESSIQAGDPITRVGTVDTRGMSGAQLLRAVFGQLDRDGRLGIVYRRDDAAITDSLLFRMFPSHWWTLLVPVLGWVVSAASLLWRAAGDLRARALFYATTCSAITLSSWIGSGNEALASANWTRFTLFHAIGPPLLLRALALLPDGEPLPARFRWIWCFAPLFALSHHWLWSTRLDLHRIGSVAYPATIAAAVSAAGLILVRNYRRSDAIGRRQLRWVLFGVLVPFSAIALTYVLGAIDPEYYLLLELSYSMTVLTPIGFAIAIGRYNLLDVDRLMSATLAVLLMAMVLGSSAVFPIPGVTDALLPSVHVAPPFVRVALAALVVAAPLALYPRLRRRVDQLLFPARHDADVVIAALLQELPRVANADEIYERVGERLREAFRPASCSLYAEKGGDYIRVYAAPAESPPRFPRDSPLIGVLRGRRTAPLTDTAGLGGTSRDAFEQAALAILAARIVTPICSGGFLLGFVALGAKASGDVYTPVDRALLVTLARLVATEVEARDRSGRAGAA